MQVMHSVRVRKTVPVMHEVVDAVSMSVIPVFVSVQVMHLEHVRKSLLVTQVVVVDESKTEWMARKGDETGRGTLESCGMARGGQSEHERAI